MVVVDRFRIPISRLVQTHKEIFTLLVISDAMISIISQLQVLHERGYVSKNLKSTTLGYTSKKLTSVFF